MKRRFVFYVRRELWTLAVGGVPWSALYGPYT